MFSNLLVFDGMLFSMQKVWGKQFFDALGFLELSKWGAVNNGFHKERERHTLNDRGSLVRTF